MGHTLTEEGLKPDASKVKAVQEMPPPKDKRACSTTSAGNDQLFAEVCPQVVRITNPLRKLTKKESEFTWDESGHGPAIAETKRILSAAPVLRYFDPAITPVLQCDASMHVVLGPV